MSLPPELASLSHADLVTKLTHYENLYKAELGSPTRDYVIIDSLALTIEDILNHLDAIG